MIIHIFGPLPPCHCQVQATHQYYRHVLDNPPPPLMRDVIYGWSLEVGVLHADVGAAVGDAQLAAEALEGVDGDVGVAGGGEAAVLVLLREQPRGHGHGVVRLVPQEEAHEGVGGDLDVDRVGHLRPRVLLLEALQLRLPPLLAAQG